VDNVPSFSSGREDFFEKGKDHRYPVSGPLILFNMLSDRLALFDPAFDDSLYLKTSVFDGLSITAILSCMAPNSRSSIWMQASLRVPQHGSKFMAAAATPPLSC
jgi:hypothetical protein